MSLEGRDHLLDVSGDKIYYGSPSLSCYWEHRHQGDEFEVVIVEVVKDRKAIRERERERLLEVDAANNPEYYNLTNNTLAARGGQIDMKAIVNPYGETYAENASRNSQLSKRDGSAKKLGFSNFGEFHKAILHSLDSGMNWSQIAKSYGKHKGYARVSMRYVNIDKFRKELDQIETFNKEVLREHIMKGCSMQKAAEVEGLEFPTARILVGDYHYGDSRRLLSAYKLGCTGDELQVKILELVLQGHTIFTAAEEIGMSRESCARYFYSALRASLKVEDVKSGEYVY